MEQGRENLYKKLKTLRQAKIDESTSKLESLITTVRPIHETSKQFKNKLRTASNRNDPKCKEDLSNLLKIISPPVYNPKAYHVVFVLDTSGSMDTPVGRTNRWMALVSAVNSFIESRRRAGARDLVTLIEYNTSCYLQCEAKPISSDFSNYFRFFGGGTSFKAGLQGAKQVIDRNKHDTYIPLLLFLSDGESSDGDSEMRALYQQHQRNGLVVRTLGFCEGGAQRLQQLAAHGGGRFLNSVDGIQLETTFTAIARELEAASLGS